MALRRLLLLFVLLCVGEQGGGGDADEAIGSRPYEMEWAGRIDDTRPPLVDFEDLHGWTAESQDAEAAWIGSREQQLWGKHVGKLVYRGTGSRPVVTVKPPKEIAVPAPFDCVNLWLYGNNWGWSPDPTTPPVTVDVLLADRDGREVRVGMGSVRWKEWWLMHARLTPDQIAALEEGAVLAGFQISGGRNKEDRVLYFDNLAIYKEPLPPLEFEPRPKWGIEPFPGQTTGTNTGPGKLPFPTREETILPDNLTTDFQVGLEQSDDAYTFTYQGQDGRLVYRYRPATGTLGDVTAEWIGRGGTFQPLADGGVYFVGPEQGDPVAPDAVELVGCRKVDNTVVSNWRCRWGKQDAEVTYTFRLWQKSLVVDVSCPGGQMAEFRVGAAVGVANPRLVTLPYLAGDQQRPAVLVTGPPGEPLFIMALVDHCRSNASSLWMANQLTEKGTFYNGGARYLPKTDGRRNDCFERLFLTVSPQLIEVLPNVPNPKSPWMHVAGERLWRAHGASNRESDYAHWKRVARYGMTKVVITDHETGWRDGGESFTFRTRAAPGKGGDEGQQEYARKIRALGFRYGIYNNYTDYAPVNEHWDEDCVTRLSDGGWHTAWPRCYNPKPARAVEFEARLAPIIQQKFQLDTAYCDVHTAVRPWSYCDFDARVPGAGTFAATFYAYGEIMLHQKRTWNGPVYSEGNNHWYYCGLTDGNYGQDQLAHLDVEPWLVDFDLRKLHPLCCNFGMGNLDMFYGHRQGVNSTPEQRDARLDRFLAATLAFGHTGFLVMEGGMPNAVRSYFNVQQVQARYAQDVVSDIRYADEQGELRDTSAAVATGAFRRSQIATTYSGGMKVLVNGHPTENWRTPEAVLPPNGWWAKDTQRGDLVAYSALVDGRRADYVDSPAYVYADGRGRFIRFPKAACDGQLIAHRRPDGSLEVIPVGQVTSFGVSVDGRTATATALDEDGREIGPAPTRLARGLVYVTPVAKALSYVLRPGDAPNVSLKCERHEVAPGETVTITGKTDHAYRVPADATAGTRLWQEQDGAWIDFTVAPMVDARLSLDGECELALTSHLAVPVDAAVTLAGQSQTVRLVPGQAVTLRSSLVRPTAEEVRAVPLTVVAGDLVQRQTWWLKAEDVTVEVARLSEQYQAGQCLRGKTEQELDAASGAQAHRRETTCGDQPRPSLFMHPPYKTGVGYTFAVFPPVDLPAEPAAVLRCEIGKGDGSDPGDGILFRALVVTPDGRQTPVAERQWIKHAWTPLEGDLAPWAGKRVQIKLVADVGEADNSSGDWAAWSNLRIESAVPVLSLSLHDEAVQLRREPGPHPCEDLTVDDLRQTKTATLHYQGIGLQNGGQYVSYGHLNGVPLGPLPSAGGDEAQGTWADASLLLPPEAVATLADWNHLTIDNPGSDCFKVRRFWIELDLGDGRRCSSMVTTPVITQPTGWLHAEGTQVPFGVKIELEMRFRTKQQPGVVPQQSKTTEDRQSGDALTEIRRLRTQWNVLKHDAMAAAVSLFIFGEGMAAVPAEAESGTIRLEVQQRTSAGRRLRETMTITPSRTAVVVVDMWDRHWCETYTRRVANMVPRMNQTLTAARKLGVTVVHAPSDVLNFYGDAPRRRAMQDVPLTEPPKLTDFNPPQPPGPTDHCECGPDQPCTRKYQAWSRQHPDLEIAQGDLIGDCNNGRELFNLCAARQIDTLIYMGVASNMCVLNRSMGILNMKRHGLRTLVMADLVNAISANGIGPDGQPNPNFTPAQGTAQVQRYIEQHVAPTLESRQLIDAAGLAPDGDPPRPHVVFVIAEREYDSQQTLPAFARKYLGDYRCTFCLAKADDGEGRDDVQGLGALYDADLLVLSMRRRRLPVTQMDHLERYIRAGKPMVALRVSVVPFQVPGKVPPGQVVWDRFDREVLGCNYQGYNPKSRETGCDVWSVPAAAAHPILDGVEAGFHSQSWIYRQRPLTDTTTTLLLGRWSTEDPDEPVAWTNAYGGARVFYTTLGHPGDFQIEAFNRMLSNAVRWALDLPETNEFGSTDE